MHNSSKLVILTNMMEYLKCRSSKCSWLKLKSTE